MAAKKSVRLKQKEILRLILLLSLDGTDKNITLIRKLNTVAATSTNKIDDAEYDRLTAY